MSSVELQLATKLFDDGEYDDALRICNGLLNDNPDDSLTLFLIGHIFMKAERWGLAYVVYKRFCDLHPDASGGWNNMGRCLQELNRYEEAEQVFRHCLTLEPDDFAPRHNLLLLAANRCRPAEAMEWADKAFAVADEGQRAEAMQSVALAYLSSRRWKEGWPAFDYSLGNKWRRDRQYADEELWDGSPGKSVVVYGEQGIGDEIMFSSMISEMFETNRVIIDCDPRLQGLFRRSFPEAVVYGTRFQKELDWPARHRIDARMSFGGLGRLYRSNGEFPRKPFLTADPERRVMWRALLDKLPGKKIGLAWTGGTRQTRQSDRSVTLEQLKPLLDTGHTFISLQYKPAPEAARHGIRHWPHAVETRDYDDTAALVAELDCVISVTTAVALLSGALGTETHVLVPEEPTWHWCIDGDMPWLPMNTYRRRGDWKPLIEQIAGKL